MCACNLTKKKRGIKQEEKASQRNGQGLWQGWGLVGGEQRGQLLHMKIMTDDIYHTNLGKCEVFILCLEIQTMLTSSTKQIQLFLFCI